MHKWGGVGWWWGRAREGQSAEGKRERGRQMVVLTLGTILSDLRSYAGSDLFSPETERRGGEKEEACLCKITQLSTAQPSPRQKTAP